MTTSSMARAIGLLACFACAFAPTPVHAEPATTTHAARDGRHDFDLRFGDWRVQHRRLKERLANSHEWIEFNGTLKMWPLMDGLANVSDNWFNMPGGAYHGVSLRAYDEKTGTWAVWWLDGRTPFDELDPPMKGRFEDGSSATLYGTITLNSKPIRVRMTWTKVTANSAHWEQSYSADGGKTWEVNWISDFQRTP